MTPSSFPRSGASNEPRAVQSADGRIEAEVRYGEDAVEVSIGVRPLGGDQDCQGNRVTPFDLELSEPLGDRELLGERPLDP